MRRFAVLRYVRAADDPKAFRVGTKGFVMFVEGEVEIRIKDKAAGLLDEHELKLWVQRAFKDLSCYRISNFKRAEDKSVRAVVALKLSVLPDAEQKLIESRPSDIGMLRSFIEKMFEGKGTCRAVGDPKLRPN